jgi:hypothetical protein
VPEHQRKHTGCNSQVTVKVVDVRVHEAMSVDARQGNWITVVVQEVIWFLHAQSKITTQIHGELVSVYGEHKICSIFDPEDRNTVLCKRYKVKS